jgi:endonuclease III
MPVERVHKVLSQDNKKLLLSKLEDIGARNIVEDLRRSLLEGLDSSLLNDKEFMLRYLLLTTVLDQQAESESARRTVRSIAQKYGYKFFMNPREYFDNIRDAIQLALGTYEPRARVLRMKKEGITLLRIGGFMLAVNSLSLRFGGLFSYFRQYRTPYELLNRGMLGEPLLSGLLYEKAARLYVGWITHPQLFIRIYGESVPRNTIPMVVNGHVTKVLARTGFLDRVSVESRDNMIVEAERERGRIENEVKRVKPDGDLFSIDYGAFFIGIRYCHERNPNCAQCPLNTICSRNTEFRAY